MLEVLVLLRMATKKAVLILENLDSQCMSFKKKSKINSEHREQQNY